MNSLVDRVTTPRISAADTLVVLHLNNDQKLSGDLGRLHQFSLPAKRVSGGM
jgi:hypothetical protein